MTNNSTQITTPHTRVCTSKLAAHDPASESCSGLQNMRRTAPFRLSDMPHRSETKGSEIGSFWFSLIDRQKKASS